MGFLLANVRAVRRAQNIAKMRKELIKKQSTEKTPSSYSDDKPERITQHVPPIVLQDNTIVNEPADSTKEELTTSDEVSNIQRSVLEQLMEADADDREIYSIKEAVEEVVEEAPNEGLQKKKKNNKKKKKKNIASTDK